MRIAVLSAVALLLAACGGVAAPAPTATGQSNAPATTTPSAAASATTTGAATSWTVASASKATASVREQLVGVSLPSDAVLTTTGAAGSFAIRPDGTFTPESKITFDLRTLASDQRDRDNYVRQSTLQVSRFPTATFVPTKASGLALPLATDSEMKFTLTGQMNIHGVTKEVTFDVVAKQSGAQLTANATATQSWKFGDFGMTAPSVPFRVVSVIDEIRLAIDLVATVAG